jgi:hypothetical protein
MKPIDYARLLYRSESNGAAIGGTRCPNNKPDRLCAASLTPTPASCRPLRVTFVVLSHNNAACLPRTLESVWQEACATGGEIVLVDDGSTDGSDEICADFAASRARVRFWRQSHHGLFRTLNMVGGASRGEWVRLCGGDTPLVPESTQRLITAAERAGAGMACGVVASGWPSATAGEAELPPETQRPLVLGLSHLARSLSFPLSSVLYRQELIEHALPLPADLVACPDLAIVFSALQRTPLARLPQAVCIAPTISASRRVEREALALLQTIRIVQLHARKLTGGQKRASLYAVARRLRRSRAQRGSPGLQIWLLGAALCGRLGLLDFHETLDRLARLGEQDLQAVPPTPSHTAADGEAGWVTPSRPAPVTPEDEVATERAAA